MDRAICFPSTYPLIVIYPVDSALHVLNNWGLKVIICVLCFNVSCLFHMKSYYVRENGNLFCWLFKLLSGLLIFRAVADPRNSGFPRNPAKFQKKREIFPNTCRQKIFHTYLGY